MKCEVQEEVSRIVRRGRRLINEGLQGAGEAWV